MLKKIIHSNKITRWLLLIAGIALLLLVVLFSIAYRSSQSSYTKTIPLDVSQIPSSAPVTRAPLPVRLKIPSINVDAAIEQVGITSMRAMDVPKGPDNAGWFDLGPRPGETGSAVLAGHEGWKNGIPAVFDYLYTVHIGDKIYIQDEKGITTAFVVHKLRLYGENEDASTVFSSSDGKAHLNLITCEGVWNSVQKSYSGRLVVFADME